MPLIYNIFALVRVVVVAVVDDDDNDDDDDDNNLYSAIYIFCPTINFAALEFCWSRFRV